MIIVKKVNKWPFEYVCHQKMFPAESAGCQGNSFILYNLLFSTYIDSLNGYTSIRTTFLQNLLQNIRPISIGNSYTKKTSLCRFLFQFFIPHNGIHKWTWYLYHIVKIGDNSVIYSHSKNILPNIIIKSNSNSIFHMYKYFYIVTHRRSSLKLSYARYNYVASFHLKQNPILNIVASKNKRHRRPQNSPTLCSV